MAYFPQLGDVLRLTAYCTRGTQTALNTGYFRVAALAGGGLSDAALAAYFSAGLATNYVQLIDTTSTYYGAGVQKILPIPVRVAQYDATGRAVGTGSGMVLPGEVTALARCFTSLAGRAFRGRIYPPFIARSLVTGDGLELLTAGVALVGAITSYFYAGTTITSGGASITLIPVVLHRKANKAGTTTPNSTTDVAGSSVELLLACQRRRGPRGRANAPPF